MSYDLSLSREQVEALYYACAHAEMMWRKRSHNPDIDRYGSYEEPEVFEATCREEMRKCRVTQKALEAQLPVDFWETDVDTILENWESEA
tara:strand:- start:31 stop:300 length:270 start_codon:yes stop_codon:yes gene_type:complete